MKKRDQQNHAAVRDDAEDFMALEDSNEPRHLSAEEQNANLKAELEALRRLQSASFEKLEKINLERKALLEREQRRLKRPRVNEVAAQANGADDVDVDMDYSSSSAD